jgi:hypothetical protein
MQLSALLLGSMANDFAPGFQDTMYPKCKPMQPKEVDITKASAKIAAAEEKRQRKAAKRVGKTC